MSERFDSQLGVASEQAAIEEPQCSRFARRRQSRTPGNLTHSSLGQAVAVLVRDSSSTGARLELVTIKGAFNPGADRLPPRFTLNIPLDRASVECEIAWRKGPMLGVRYVSPAQTHPRQTKSRQLKQEPPSKLMKLLGLAGVKPL